MHVFRVAVDVLWFAVAESTWFMNRGYMNSTAVYQRRRVSVLTLRVNRTRGPIVLLRVVCVVFLVISDKIVSTRPSAKPCEGMHMSGLLLSTGL